jgi:hypothetical protein
MTVSEMGIGVRPRAVKVKLKVDVLAEMCTALTIAELN